MAELSQYYETHTTGCKVDAPWVVMLPGVGCGAWFYEAALPYFLPDYKVLLFNNPGSSGLPMPLFMTVKSIARLVMRILEKEGLENFHLFGHSMGGYTAQIIAAQYGRNVRRMVLCSTGYGGPQSTEALQHVLQDLKWDMWRMRKLTTADRDALFAKTFSEKFRTEKPEAYKTFMDFKKSHWPPNSIVARQFMCGAQYDGRKILSSITAPTLVIHGAHDWLLKADYAQQLVEKIPFSQLWRIQECGHFPMAEVTHFYQRVRDFYEIRNASAGRGLYRGC